MPCNSDYMEPTRAELNSKETAQNLQYALTWLCKDVPEYVVTAANNSYGDQSKLNKMTVKLCETLRELESADAVMFDQLVYNGRDKRSRQLAEWWEKHDEADKAREAQETVDSIRKKNVKSAMAKLTKDEIQALKDTWGE